MKWDFQKAGVVSESDLEAAKSALSAALRAEVGGLLLGFSLANASKTWQTSSFSCCFGRYSACLSHERVGVQWFFYLFYGSWPPVV